MSADWETAKRPDGTQGTPAAEKTAPSQAAPSAEASAEELAARFRAAPLRAPEGPMTLPPASSRASTHREIPPHVRRVFLEETAEDMERMRATYLQVTHDAPDPGRQLHTLKQIAHKIKGSAATFSYPLIAKVAMATEEWIERVEATSTPAQRQEVERRIGEGLTLLDALVADRSEGREPASDLATRATAFAVASAPSASGRGMGETRPLATVPTPSARGSHPLDAAPATPRPDAAEALDAPGGEATPGLMLHVPSRQVDSLINQLSEVAVNRALLATVRADLAALEDELCRTRTRLESRTETIGDAYPRCALPPTGEPASEQQEEVTLAVRSLREAVADLGAHVMQFRALLGTLGQAARQQDEQMRAVRDEAVHMRLVPFSALETRLRVTADMCARDCGKAVDLTVTGGETRIDREMVDQLRGPLTQLITNAVVHAIETPEERVRAGKSPHGQILVEAHLRQSEVHITVADDGQGSDAHAFVRAAIERGILTSEQARGLAPARALNLMFEPGLTTEGTAGLLAGRGIGLDQVRTTVRDLRGQISVQSNTGQGTIFRLRLPISQTVLTVIEVASAGEHYAVPLALLSGVFSLTRSGPLPPGTPTAGMGAPRGLDAMSMDERARLVERLAAHVRGTGAELAPLEGVRVLSLAALVGQRTPGTGEVALLLEVDGGYAAVLVDEVLGEREVVVRPLATYLRRPSIWGAAVTPEGEMLLLLDLPTLVRAAGPEEALAGLSASRGEDQVGASGGPRAHVLVVDDSPTVRHHVSGILKQAGYRITEARDGVEAIGQLSAMPTDVIVLDIEMPDLDGLGLLHILRSNPHFTDVPVVVLSSRDTADVRQQANALGVRAFLAKPCPPEHLLSAVRRVVTR